MAEKSLRNTAKQDRSTTQNNWEAGLNKSSETMETKLGHWSHCLRPKCVFICAAFPYQRCWRLTSPLIGFLRASISRDPFYDMLATRKRRIANKKWSRRPRTTTSPKPVPSDTHTAFWDGPRGSDGSQLKNLMFIVPLSVFQLVWKHSCPDLFVFAWFVCVCTHAGDVNELSLRMSDRKSHFASETRPSMVMVQASVTLRGQSLLKVLETHIDANEPMLTLGGGLESAGLISCR